MVEFLAKKRSELVIIVLIQIVDIRLIGFLFAIVHFYISIIRQMGNRVIPQ